MVEYKVIQGTGEEVAGERRVGRPMMVKYRGYGKDTRSRGGSSRAREDRWMVAVQGVSGKNARILTSIYSKLINTKNKL